MLIATFYPTSGGSEISAQRLSRRLIENLGWQVRVLTRRHKHNERSLPPRDTVDGLPVVRVFSPRKFGAFFHLASGLCHLARFGRGSIYHAHDTKVSHWLAVIARFLLSGRSIIKLRSGRLPYERRLEMSLLRRLHFLIPIRLADRIIVVNQEIEEFVQELGVSPDRVVRIPNAVDTKFFHPITDREKLNVRNQLGLPNDKRIFLYTGSFRPIKGTDVLLRAWALLPKSMRKTLLLILVGGDKDHDKTSTLLDHLNIYEGVKIVGLKKSIRNYYWAADFFVLPSRSEGLSNALLEAMSCSLPVISSKVGGTLDVLENGVNGILFESEDHEQLAECIIEILQMEDQWVALGAQGRKIVQRYAELDTCTQILSDMYQQLF